MRSSADEQVRESQPHFFLWTGLNAVQHKSPSRRESWRDGGKTLVFLKTLLCTFNSLTHLQQEQGGMPLARPYLRHQLEIGTYDCPPLIPGFERDPISFFSDTPQL